MAYEVEYTDTFGGQANYCWVRRATVPSGSRRALVRRAKAAVGLTGVRGRVTDEYGDGFEWRPWGVAAVMFVEWREPVEPTPLEDFEF